MSEESLAEKQEDLENTVEISPLCCGHCMGETWEVFVGTSKTDGQELLLIRCSSPKCVERVKKQLQDSGAATEEDSVLWKVFDITGQGHASDMIHVPSSGYLPTGDGSLN